jgi:hypothetical protein
MPIDSISYFYCREGDYFAISNETSRRKTVRTNCNFQQRSDYENKLCKKTGGDFIVAGDMFFCRPGHSAGALSSAHDSVPAAESD